MNKKALIVGACPLQDTSFIKRYQDGYFKVACDAGYTAFLQEGVEPDRLVGDFDTLDQRKIQKPKEIVQLNPIKDDSDTFHAIETLLQEGYERFYFYGCLGGKIDHTIANLQVLSYLSDRNAKGILVSDDGEKIIFLLKNESIDFSLMQEGFLSVFSYGGKAIGVTETGLKYEIADYDFSDNVPTLGLSNQFIGKRSSISVKNGKLLIVTPKESIRDLEPQL